MAFLDKTDLLNYIDASTIDQITDSTDPIVVNSISDAEDRIREKISPRFDMDVEFAKVGAARNRSLLKHAIGLSIYYLFQRLYTDVVPEGRVEAMDHAEEWLEDVYKGKINVNLATVDDANERGWVLKWGSQPKKGSQNY